MTAPTPIGGHILVVDDEPPLLRALTMNLTSRGYRVTTATDGAMAVELAAMTHPDAVILDLGLPDIDGLEVIQRIRARTTSLPILVLSARSGSNEKVAALDHGANDYVTKPFDVRELLARLRAATRSSSEPAGASPTVRLGAITVDLADRIVRRDDDTDHTSTTIRLTPTEWRMLDTLLRRPGKLITPGELLTAMRGDPAHTERSYLRIYLQQLRRKLEPDPTQPRYLLTEPGLGYRYQP